MMQLYYNDDYVAADVDFETTRKSAWIAQALESAPLGDVVVTSPASIDEQLLRQVHDSCYVDAIRTGVPISLAESQGFRWDPGIWRMAIATNGGMIAAARDAIEHGVAGSLSSGLHHARRVRGIGFCTFNGIALAAVDALERGIGGILILDFDAHGGGGTKDCLVDRKSVWQFDLATNDFDGGYEQDERFRRRLVVHENDYLPATTEILNDAVAVVPQCGLCLYNAGVDPHEAVEFGSCPGVTSSVLHQRDEMVFRWCAERGLPVAFAIAGGYIGATLGRETLVRLHLNTVAAAAKVYRDYKWNQP